MRDSWYPAFWKSHGGLSYNFHEPPSANFLFSNMGTTQELSAITTFGVINPGAVHALYIHSAELSQLTAVGPDPRTNSCICKLMVTEAHGKTVFQSVYRPHRYTVPPPQTITQLTWTVRDAHGTVTNMRGTKFSMVLVFHHESE